jgi:hypothetical protein
MVQLIVPVAIGKSNAALVSLLFNNLLAQRFSLGG